MIEEFVAGSECSEEMLDEYNAAQVSSCKVTGERMFAEGNVLEAANVGHPESMGEMAGNYASGNNGFDSEHEKAYAFAVKVAIDNEGDEGGQFILGVCFQNGWVVEKD